jgi:hypothetical protein
MGLNRFGSLGAIGLFLWLWPHPPQVVSIPGHPYQTYLNCKRTKPLGQFDPKCDLPVLGYKDFYRPPGLGNL